MLIRSNPRRGCYVLSSAVAALRYDATIVQEQVVAGTKRMDFPSPLKRSWVFFCSSARRPANRSLSSMTLALSAIRVGATTGVVHRALAKKHFKVVGIFGFGDEARTTKFASSGKS
jgi:hypothetical protein